ncbi:MAG TPA: ATP-binding protein [Actinomycetota bacterium]|nr:ATP-binding protein [Actinomycetota bacterium]
MAAVVELEIPPRSQYVGVVRLALSALARGAGLDDEVVEDLKIAVSEACTNAVLSHEEAATDAAVCVTWTRGAGEVAVEVGDRGPVYDVDADDPDTQGFSTRLAMSIALLRSLVDECTIAARPDGGMCTRLVVRSPA